MEGGSASGGSGEANAAASGTSVTVRGSNGQQFVLTAGGGGGGVSSPGGGGGPGSSSSGGSPSSNAKGRGDLRFLFWGFGGVLLFIFLIFLHGFLA